VPDEELARADEVVLIDVTPEALIARLRRGEVYPHARVPAALGGFFRIENLQALREVALRQVAEDVEAKRLTRDALDIREERLFGSPVPRAIAERLLALAKLDPRSERVVRRAWRSAQRLGAELDVLVVRDPAAPPGTAERDGLESLRRLCSVLGAHLIVEHGDDLADVAIRVARERGTTYVLMGTPAARRGLARLAGEPLPLRLAHALPEVDVRLVARRDTTG
jgi:two-component system sensor histidine kinase KdpD